MSKKLIEARGLDFVPVSKGYIRGYRLVFHRFSTDWDGLTATLEPKEDSVVWGMIFKTSAESLERLDEFEGIPKEDVRRISVEVVVNEWPDTESQPVVADNGNLVVLAQTYVRDLSTLPDIGNFSFNYLKLLEESYEEYDFPSDQRQIIAQYRAKTFFVDRTRRRPRWKTKGKYLLEINRDALAKTDFKEGSEVVVAYKKQFAPATLYSSADISDEKICRLDRSIRDVLGLKHGSLTRATITLYPMSVHPLEDQTRGERMAERILFILSVIFFAWLPAMLIQRLLYPRSFLLKVTPMEADVVEKNFVTMNQKYIKYMGIEEGKFINVGVPVHNSQSFDLKMIRIRVYSDDSEESKKQTIFLDESTRWLIGLDERLETADFPFAVVTPDIRSLITERSVIYLATLVFVIGRFQTIMINFGGEDSLLALWTATVLSIWLLSLVIYYELRAKVRY